MTKTFGSKSKQEVALAVNACPYHNTALLTTLTDKGGSLFLILRNAVPDMYLLATIGQLQLKFVPACSISGSYATERSVSKASMRNSAVFTR